MLSEVSAGGLRDLSPVYAGAVVVLRQLPAMIQLCRHFESHLPYQSLDKQQHSASQPAAALELCAAWESDPVVQQLFQAMWEQAGLDCSATYADRVRLRVPTRPLRHCSYRQWLQVQQPGAPVDDVSACQTSGGRYSCTLPIHRDTWASNIGCCPLVALTGD